VQVQRGGVGEVWNPSTGVVTRVLGPTVEAHVFKGCWSTFDRRECGGCTPIG
jgi:hypothetical protein